MSDAQRVEFVAIIPSIQALKFHGDGGARLTLDIDQSQESELVRLLGMRDTLLKVSIEVAEDGRGQTETRRRLHI